MTKNEEEEERRIVEHIERTSNVVTILNALFLLDEASQSYE